MASYIGADWAKKGWFAVILSDDGGWDSDLFPSVWSLWNRHGAKAELMLIDIPIGLCEADQRACDVEAKRRLSPERQNSVFYTPIREAVYRPNLDLAKACQEERDVGFSIQNQAWGIVPRIREVDEFVASVDGSDRVRETHPEVCFAALNNGDPVRSSKATERGRKRRLALLDDLSVPTREIYSESVELYTTPDYAPVVSRKDDILDALVAATTARGGVDGLSSLPEEHAGQIDGHLDRAIEIMYPSD